MKNPNPELIQPLHVITHEARCGGAIAAVPDDSDAQPAEPHFIVPRAYYGRIPIALIEGLTRYFNDSTETGGFLRAVLENDLQGAVTRMNPRDMDVLWSLIQLLLEAAPVCAYGTPFKVARWLEEKLPLGEEAEETARRG